MSDPNPDLRYVLVDIEGMEDGDLVQFTDGHFAKFTPLEEWEELAYPGDTRNFREVLVNDLGVPENSAPAIPSFGVRLDGVGGVSVKGAIGGTAGELLALDDGNGGGMDLATLDEQYRPATRAVGTSALFIIAGPTNQAAFPGTAGIMLLPGTLQVGTDGKMKFQVTQNVGAWDTTVLDLIEDDDVIALNLNVHYDTLA